MEALGAQIEATGGNAPVEADRPDAGRGGMRPGEEVRPLRVLMVAGGTGGHIFPALAVAEELRERSQHRQPGGKACEILFLGTGRGLEARLIPAAGFPLRTVAAAGLKGIGGWRKLRNLLVLPRSALETALVIRDLRPDVVVGIGGYLAGPAMLEAALKDIPTLLIEPNAVPGFTNRVLTPVVRLAAVAFEETANLYGAKGRLTGHAVRKAFSFVPCKEHVPPFTVLVLGGSQGSVAINECVVKSLPLLAKDPERMRFIHQTGDRDYNAVRQAYQERGLTAEVHAFIENVPEAFARADLIVSRAGATAVAELAVAGKAALLIPFPGATDQHQLENARAMERAGAASVIQQAELTPQRLVTELRDLLGEPRRLVEMEQAARRLARPDAAAQIADLVEELGGIRRTASNGRRTANSDS
ncbi:MAG: undecaprenyldiphospho-muramoylpentapeptide beta-N-acetylglucosaminyltransferase [Terriglobia bacterium]